MTGSKSAEDQSASPTGAGPAASPKSTGGSPGSKPASPASAGSPRNLGPVVDPGLEQAVEADDAEIPEDDNDADSALGEPVASTASIASSILRYRTIHGRRFHSDTGNALYWGSNDEAQSESMDLIHHMWTIALDGKLHLAPISSDIKKAVDIGCGTGMWAMDFADEFPSCEVIGTDISPIQPSWVPPNLRFEVDDCTQEWTWDADSIDYVHIRYLVGTIEDWTELFRQAFRTLKPGGYLESFEASPYTESDDGTITPKMAMGQWGDIFVEGSKKTGRSFRVVPDGTQRKAMEEAGFVDIQEWNYKCPLSPWPKDPKLKEMGVFGEAFSTGDTEGFLTFVSSILGWSREQFMVFNAAFRREIHDTRNHGYFRIKVVWGRKP